MKMHKYNNFFLLVYRRLLGFPVSRRVIALTNAASLVEILNRNKYLFMNLKININIPYQRKILGTVSANRIFVK